jgi:hypothetical protein
VPVEVIGSFNNFWDIPKANSVNPVASVTSVLSVAS